MIVFPLVVTSAGMSLLFVLVGTPLWAILGGAFFAGLANGKGGSVASHFGVKFFSDGHPIFQTTQDMAARLGLPPVKWVGWYDADDINAFTSGTGAKDTLIAFSKGAVERLSKDRFDAVVGHELGHIASNDVARMGYAEGVQDAMSFYLLFRGLRKFARWVFTPLSELELLRFSRKREFSADAIAARLTSPDAMIGALESLRDQETPVQTKGVPAQMLYAGFSTGDIFSTHPPIEARIAALEALRGK